MAQPVRSFANRLHEAFSEKFNFKTILALVVFGMIILTFIFSGMLSGGKGSLGLGVAATVNGEIISIKQFQDQENRISAYYSQMLGGQFENLIQKKQLQTEALNQLVDNSVAAQAAQHEMIFATDSSLREAIAEMPYFKKDGVFQSDLYKGILAQNGMTPGEFEKSMRQQITIQKVRDLFEAATVVTSLEKNADMDLKASKLNLYYLKISPELFNNSQILSDATVQAELAKPEFKEKVATYIKGHESEFGTPAQVKASHILIKADEKNADDMKRAEKTAQDVLKQAQAGDFAALAKKYSDDPGSKEKGGDLGFFAQGSMVPEFEKAAFGLEKGKISGLVKSPYGYHIIKVTDKKAATHKSETEAHIITGRKLLAERKSLEAAKEIEGHIAKNTDQKSTEELLNKMNLKLKETGAFDISAETVPTINSTQVFKTALDLTKDKPVAKNLVKDGEAHYLVILKEMTKAPDTAKLEDKRNEMMDKQKSYSQYQFWLEGRKKSFSIHKNMDLLIQ